MTDFIQLLDELYDVADEANIRFRLRVWDTEEGFEGKVVVGKPPNKAFPDSKRSIKFGGYEIQFVTWDSGAESRRSSSSLKQAVIDATNYIKENHANDD